MRIIYLSMALLIYFLLTISVVFSWMASNTNVRGGLSDVSVTDKSTTIQYSSYKNDFSQSPVSGNFSYKDMLPGDSIIFLIAVTAHTKTDYLDFSLLGLTASEISIPDLDRVDPDPTGSFSLAYMYTHNYVVVDGIAVMANGEVVTARKTEILEELAKNENTGRFDENTDTLISGRYDHGDVEIIKQLSLLDSEYPVPFTVAIEITFDPEGLTDGAGELISLKNVNLLTDGSFQYRSLNVGY